MGAECAARVLYWHRSTHMTFNNRKTSLLTPHFALQQPPRCMTCLPIQLPRLPPSIRNCETLRGAQTSSDIQMQIYIFMRNCLSAFETLENFRSSSAAAIVCEKFFMPRRWLAQYFADKQRTNPRDSSAFRKWIPTKTTFSERKTFSSLLINLSQKQSTRQ